MNLRSIRWLTVAAVGVTLAAGGAQGASPSPAREEATASPPVASVLPSASPGVPVPVLTEPFDAPSDRWWTGRDERERTAIEDGVLRTRLRTKGASSTWQWVDLPAATDRVRVQAQVLVERGPGGGGPICGDAAGDGHWYWGGINGDGEWLLGWISGSRVHVEQRGDRPVVRDPEAPVGAPYPVPVTLECAVGPDGASDRVTLAVQGVPVAEMAKQRVGPYPQVGLMVAGDKAGVTVTFDDLLAWDAAALEAAPAPSPTASPSGSPPPSPAP